MNTAIVTGAAGFAGCNLTETLIDQGYNVIAVLRPNSAHNSRMEPLKASGRLICVELDISEIGKLPELISGKDADTFFHLAWSGERDDFNAQYKNIADTVNSLEAAAAAGCGRFICTGSQAEYGITESIQTEDMCPSPFSAYGAAKTAAMYLSKRRAGQLSIEWIWGRIFSLYGRYEPSKTLVQYIINAVKNDEAIHVTSAEQNWDYLDAIDAANALIALGERGKDGEIYNIANGSYRPLKEFIEEIVKKTAVQEGCSLHNSTYPAVHYDKIAAETVSLQPSVEKIKHDTGWQPKRKFME